jgi:hypothetical protein
MGVTANTLQVAPGMNTTGDGSKLPEGNVGLDMIMGLMKGVNNGIRSTKDIPN